MRFKFLTLALTLVASAATTATTTATTTTTTTAATTAPLEWRGISLASAEFGETIWPGVYGQHYVYPEPAAPLTSPART